MHKLFDMTDKHFTEMGKEESISALYEGTGFSRTRNCCARPQETNNVISASRLFQEGIDFDLVYFPLKHLGYKCVVAVTGELYAFLSHPSSLNVVLGISAKLGYSHIQELWSGMVAAAKEHGYAQVSLDLVPCRNGLSVSVSSTGLRSLLTSKRIPAAKSKDLICVSGSLGAAYMGMRVLEREKKGFDGNGTPDHKSLETYKMLVGSYLRPELDSATVSALEKAEIYPSYGAFVTNGLSDSIKRLSVMTGLGAKIYAEKIPFEGNSFQLGKEINVDPISAAMNGGDDFRLLFTVPILSLEKFRRDFQTFDIIGHLALPEAGTTLVTPEGVELPLKAQGWKEDKEQ